MDMQTFEHFKAIRHHLHQHPELEGDTIETAALVAENLAAYGYIVHQQVGGHGVVGVLKKGNSSRSLGIRADMDALPIHEKNQVAYSSQYAGKMHACGHDGHTTILLAAAQYIAQQLEYDGTLNLIFQPAEEVLTGAKQMMNDGLFDRFPCDAVYALHNLPGIPLGTVAVQAGYMMASSQRMDLKIWGRGGHGALPELAIDPIPAVAALIQGINSIKSRNLAIDEDAVISIGRVHAGTTYNVIPSEANIALSIRTDSRAVLDKINQRIEEIVQGIELQFQVKIEMSLQFLVPPLLNSADETELLVAALQQQTEATITVQQPQKKLMTSEDFAWMLDEIPGAYFFLGNGEGAFPGCSIHHPEYDFNDENIRWGMQCWVALVETFLAPTTCKFPR